MKQIFHEYLVENVNDYDDYKISSFGLYDGVNNNRGYAGINRYYQIEYVHKKHDGIRFYITTDAYNLVSDYQSAKKQLDYINISMDLFQKNIDEKSIKLKSVYFSRYSDFFGLPASEEVVLKNIDAFEPEIEVNCEKISFQKLVELDDLIKQTFPKGCFYILKLNNKEYTCYSDNLKEYKSYEEFYK